MQLLELRNGCTNTSFLKKTALILCALLINKLNYSQNLTTWVHGTTALDPAGIYGTQGTAAAANTPGGRYSSVTWKDASGNLWLFGGMGLDINGVMGYLNDLWKYNVSTNQWTWIKGDDNADPLATYGTKGLAAAANNPGGRSEAVSWTDASGNFWLFGGNGYSNSAYGDLNDLWKYNVSTNQWTWMSGSSIVNQSGTYGTMGTAAAANIPGGRSFHTGWADASGNLWLFGGFGTAAAAGPSSLNDLWKYNISTNQWTWMGGSNTVDQTGTYGTINLASATNKPGSRWGAKPWVDNSGNFYLFGGYGYASSNNGHLNDLWRYNPSTGQWTWMSGSNSINPSGSYGSIGVAAASNVPNSRAYALTWKDAQGNLILFGGNNPATGDYNDVWKFDLSSNLWTWISGGNLTNQQGVYGTQGTASVLNTPGSRYCASGWTDNSNNPWIFGGYGNNNSNNTGYLNDLWRFTLCGSSPTVSVSSSTSTLCLGGTTTLTATGANSYTWSNNQTGSVTVITPANAGVVSMSVTPGYTNGCVGSNSTAISFTTHSKPTATLSSSTPTFCLGGSTTLTATGGASYLWSNNQTGSVTVITPANSGVTTISVTPTAANGCAGSGTTAISFTAYGLPTATLSSSSPTSCLGGSTTLTAIGGNSYLWSNNQTGSVTVVTPATSGITTISVIATNANGCSGSGNTAISFTTYALPTATLASSHPTFCLGGSTTLTAVGGSSYLWSNNQTGSVTVVTPANSGIGTISVTPTSSNGCVASAPTAISFTSNALPTATLASSHPTFCLGGSTTLTATGGVSYLWSNNQTGSVTVITPANSGVNTISVTPTDANGCAGSDNTAISFTAYGLPTATISASSPTLCLGGSTTLTAIGGSNYLWSNNQTGSVTVVTPANSGINTISVTATNANGCAGSGNTAVSFTTYALPTATLSSSNPTFCLGGSTTLTATGGASYLWSNNQTGSVTVITPATSGVSTVSITPTDVNGCVASAPTAISFTASALPTATLASSNPTFCLGGTTTLTAIGGVSYLWSNNQTGSVTVITPANSGVNTISITPTDANGCIGSGNTAISFTAYGVPTATLSASSPTSCLGGSTTLTAIGGTSYLWSNNQTGSVTIVTPANSGVTTISVTASNANGCAGSGNTAISFTTYALPTVILTASNPTFCLGGSTSLTAMGAASYLWSNNQTGSVTASTPLNAGVSSMSVVSTSTDGCVANGATVVSFTAYALPTVILTASNPTFCVGGTTSLTAMGAANYVWSNNQTGSVTASSPATAGAHSMSVVSTSSNGCVANGATVVSYTTYALPVITAAASNPTFCLGGSATLTANGGVNYLWSNNQAGSLTVVTPVNAGVNTITVTGNNSNGCSNTAIVSVTGYTIPALTLTSSNPQLCIGNSVVLTATGADSYVWSGSPVTAASLTVTPTVTTVYTVSGTSSNGCSATTTITQIVNRCTGIEENTTANVRYNVYPNPSNGTFTISGSRFGNATQMVIYNVLGQKVSVHQVDAEQTKIQVELPQGLYNYSVMENEQAIGSGKIIIE